MLDCFYQGLLSRHGPLLDMLPTGFSHVMAEVTYTECKIKIFVMAIEHFKQG